jgi:hypothetical protein
MKGLGQMEGAAHLLDHRKYFLACLYKNSLKNNSYKMQEKETK